MKTRWLRLIVTVLSAIVGIFLLLFLLLLTPPAKKIAFEQLCNYLRSRSGIELNASLLQLDFFRGEMELKNPVIRSATKPDMPPIFQANRIYIKVGVLEALRGNWIIEDVNLIEPQIHYFAGQDGQTNLPAFSSDSGPSPDLLILNATATDGSFHFQDLRRNLSATIPQWQLSVNGSRRTSSHDIVFACVHDSRFEYESMAIPVNSLEFRGILKNKDLQIEQIQIEAADSRLLAAGSLVDLSNPTIDLKFTPDIDLGEIASILNPEETIQGRVSGEILASGESQNIQIQAQLIGEDISARDYIKTSFGLNLQADWNRDSETLSLHSCDLTSPEGSISAEAELFTGSGEGIHSVEANLRDLNLLPIWRQLNAPFDLASRGSGKISLQWTGAFSPLKMNGRANLNLKASRKKSDLNLLPISGTLDAQIRSDRIRVDMRSLAILGTEVNGQFDLRSFQDIEGDFRGNAPNINNLMEQLSQFLGMPEYLVGVDMAGPIQLNVQVSGKLKQPKIVAAVSANTLQLGDLRNLRASVEATILGSQVDFSNIIRLPQDSTLSIKGSLGLGEAKTLLSLDLNTDAMPLVALSSILNSDIQVSGFLKTSLHVDGTMDNLNGFGSITGEDLGFYGEPLGQLDIELRMSNGEIQSTKFRLARDPQHADTDYLDARVLYVLGSGQFQFQAEGKGLTLEQLKLPEIGAIGGSVNLTATGEGTARQPSIDLTLESNNLHVRERSIGPTSVSGMLRNGQIVIETQAPDIGVSSTTIVATQDPYPFNGELQVKIPDLSRFGLKGLGEQPLSGIFEGSLDASGNLAELARTRLSATIQRFQLQTGELEIHTQNPLQMEYRDDSFAIISTASIVSGNSLLEITGGLPIRKSAASDTLHFRGQIDLTQATGVLPVPAGYKASGILNLDLALTGMPQELLSSGTVRLNDGLILIPKLATPLTNVTLRANIRDGSLIVRQANASWGQGGIDITGELPFGLLSEVIPLKFAAKEGPARFVLDISNLRPETTGTLPKDIKGLISFHAVGETWGTDLYSLSAQADFRDFDLQFRDIEFSQKVPSSISIRDGIATVSQLSLAGPETNIDISGSAGLYSDGPLNLKLAGDLDSALFTAATQNLKIAGRLNVQAEIAGSLNAPTLTGHVDMNGGRVNLRNPRIVADSLKIGMDFTSDEISIRECKGTLNGGSIDLAGSIGYRSGTLDDFNLKATLQDFFLNFPEGLKSASNGNLTIRSSEDSIVVGGNIRVLESSYREPLEVGGQLTEYLKAQQVLEIGRERDPLLERIRLDIAIQTAAPLLVQNNVAEVEARANLRLVGTYYDPSITGRVTLNEGGEIKLNQQSYYINRGAITLADQTHIEPDLNIRAQTRVGNYDITLQLTGTPNKLTTALSSEPALSEQDILSLLLTGRTLSEAQGRETQTVPTQALSLIAGQAGEEVSREARQLLHLSTFRIDPDLIAPESDPGARLTIGQDITKDFNLAYSMNLVNGGDQIWIAQYDVARSFSTQATRQQDNSFRLDLRHNLRFGGPSRRSRSQSTVTRFEIGSIQIQGAEPFSEKALLDSFKLKTGDKYDFQKIQNGLDRLQDYYFDQKRLEANIRMQRDTQQSIVNLNLNIESGPVVDFIYEGTHIPGSLRKKVEKAWENGVFETERLEDAVMVIRRSLIQAGFLETEVTCEVEMANDRKLVHFHIAPGSRYGKIPITFAGATGIGPPELTNVLDQANLRVDVYADSEKVVDYLERYYRENGYLQAKVDLPQLQLDSETSSGQVSISIQEGPLFLIGDLNFSGNRAFDYDQLWSVIPTSSGSSYDPNTLRDAVKALENLYHSKGYNDVAVTFRVVQDSETPRAHLTFQITEHKQSIIRDITIEGNSGTSQTFVRRQLDFEVGEILDFRKIDVTRRRLYATGVYTSVDFQTEEISFDEAAPQEKSVLVRISLRETQPYGLQYGIFYDTERGPGGILEAQNLNFLGSASNLGMRLRYDPDLKEARLFFNQPFVTKIHMKMNLSAFYQQENREAFDARRIGFSIFREKNLPREFRFDYGYRYDHVRWHGLPDDPTIYQSDAPVGRVVFTLARDTRDSFLDATRGEFASHSLEIGPRFLGSETGFARYHGQYFRYVPLDKLFGRSLKDAEGKRKPAKIFYAGALRLGLSGAFSGKEVISPERFFAGGGTTMRGFEQDMLGPIEVLENGLRRPLGGEAMLLFNNEIRFPIVSIFQGVTFLDLGNVYRNLSDFDFTVRKSAGIGLRLKIKYVPIRFDYGWKLDHLRQGEGAGAFFFSIGQAF